MAGRTNTRPLSPGGERARVRGESGQSVAERMLESLSVG